MEANLDDPLRPAGRGKAGAQPGVKPKPKPKPATEPRLSRQRKPPAMPADDWQRALRRQFGREQGFQLQNLGDADKGVKQSPVFSEFRVSNTDNGGHYRVAIRGAASGDNLCTCPDFATNDLGTCKHIEFTLARLAARRGGKAALARGFVPPCSEVFLHHGGLRTVRFRPGADCPPALLASAGRLFDAPADWTLPWPRLGELDAFIASARKTLHELRVDEPTLVFAAQVRDAERRQLALAEAYPKGAADKGLGKTVQAIAAAELLARHFGVQRVLVVCPTSLKQQWQREIVRFTGRPVQQAQVLQGLRPARQQQHREEAFCRITSYETLVRDADLVRAWAPELPIIDEAQRVKNWNTVAARALKRIEMPSVPGGTHWGGGVSISARDQARIGQCLLVDGVHAGRRLLPEGWVAWMCQPCAIAPFNGWLVWLNPAGRSFPGASAESFFMQGAGGHTVWIDPARAGTFVEAMAQALD